MNGPRNMVKARKRFVCAATMAAVFLLLAGGTSALANTVWCVTKTSVYPYPTCTPSTTSSTISGVFSLSPPPAAFDVIVVAPGYYNETVLIPTAYLTVMGAQAGKDARVDRYDSSKESIVDASGSPTGSGGGAAFDGGWRRHCLSCRRPPARPKSRYGIRGAVRQRRDESAHT